MKDFDERAQWSIARLTEHGLGEEIISHADLDKIIETLDFLRLHAGALEFHLKEMCDWRGNNRKGSNPPAPATRPVPPPNPPPVGQSKCGWRPIEEAPKFGELPVLVWDRGDLVEVLWEREHKTDALSWCQFSTDKYGTDVWKMEPQPKYYLAVTAPPEE